MLTLQRMRDWQKYLLIPLFIGIAISFGVGATMTSFFSSPSNRAVGEIYWKEVLSTELSQTSLELRMLKAFYQYFPHPSLMDDDVYTWTNMMNFRRTRGQASNYVVNVLDTIVQPEADVSEAWAYLVFVKTGERWGLNVGEDAVEKRIIEAFTFEGSSNLDLFQNVMGQFGTTDTMFVEALRRFMIVEKMASLMIRSSVGSKEYAFDTFKNKEQQRKALYIKFDPETYRENLTVTDEELFDYYTKNKRGKYTAPRKFRVRAALLEFDRYLGDVAVSDNEIQDYYDRYKDHLYADGENEDGDIQHKTLADVRDSVIANLKYESLPEVVRAKGVKVKIDLEQWLKDKKEQVRAEEEKENKDKDEDKKDEPNPTPDGIRYIDNKYLLDFSELRTTYGDGIRVVDTEFLDPNDIDLDTLEDLKELFSPQFQRQIKQLSRNNISDVIVDGNKAMVLQVISESTRGVEAFELIRDDVKTDLIEERIVTLAEEDSQLKFALIKDDVDIAKMAMNEKLALVETEFIKNPRYYADEAKLEGIPEEDKALLTDLFSQEPQVAKQLKAKTSSYIFAVLEVKDPSLADLPEEDVENGMSTSQRMSIFNNARNMRDMIIGGSESEFYAKPESVSASQ